MNSKLCVPTFIALFIVLGAARREDFFCRMESCGKELHTLCKYSWLNVSAECGTVTRAGITYRELDEIIDAHNEFRQRVATGKEERGNPGPQPAATNMEKVEWNNDLAGVAQTWADQCLHRHDSCRNLPAYVVGQNIAWESISLKKEATSLRGLIQEWYDEVEYVNPNMVSAYEYADLWSHYTQLVWAKSTKVGCGVIRYSTDNKKKITFLVCNYGPAGNVRGKPLYETASRQKNPYLYRLKSIPTNANL